MSDKMSRLAKTPESAVTLRSGALAQQSRARSVGPTIVDEALRSPGHPLDGNLGRVAEARFGHDFSRIRVYSDGRAAAPASAVNEPAFTDLAVRPKRAPTAEFGSVGHGSAAPQIVHDALASPGSALPASVRTGFEHLFDTDFGHVRIHTDGLAQQSARAVGARAYTVANHVVFGQDAYAPGTCSGRSLIAHELTHVIQHGSALLPSCRGPLRIDDSGEDTAKRAAYGAVAGRRPHSPYTGREHGDAAMLRRVVPEIIPTSPQLGEVVLDGFKTVSAIGRATADGVTLGEGVEGAWAAANSGTTLTGGTLVGAVEAPTTVAVGGAAVATDASIVTGGALTAGAGITAGTVAAAAGTLVLGAIIIGATTYFIVEGLRRGGPQKVGPGEEFPGTSLPGGAPEPAQAPGTTPAEPIEAPGTETTPSVAPGATAVTPVKAPGTSQGPVKAPGIVDDPAECAKQIKGGKTHQHHIFPVEYINEFDSLNIEVDDYVVPLEPTKHIGKNGIHVVFDWNAVWGDFFSEIPINLTEAEISKYAKKAFDLAIELLNDAGIASKPVQKYK